MEQFQVLVDKNLYQSNFKYFTVIFDPTYTRRIIVPVASLFQALGSRERKKGEREKNEGGLPRTWNRLSRCLLKHFTPVFPRPIKSSLTYAKQRSVGKENSINEIKIV